MKPQDPAEPLKNQRHEIFAQLIVEGETQAEAFVKAGYRRSDPNARRLTRNDPVRERIRHLKSLAAEHTLTNVEDLIAAAKRIMKAAEHELQLTAAVGALKELGILTGHRIEKREHTRKTTAELSDAELIELIKAGGGELPRYDRLLLSN